MLGSLRPVLSARILRAAHLDLGRAVGVGLGHVEDLLEDGLC